MCEAKETVLYHAAMLKPQSFLISKGGPLLPESSCPYIYDFLPS